MPAATESSLLLPSSVAFGQPPSEVDGRIVSADRERAQVELMAPAPDQLQPGTGVVLRPEAGRNLELVGVVDAVDGTRLSVVLSRAGRAEDDRWSPREKGRLRFRYMPAPAGLDLRAWVGGEPSPIGAWVEPDPRVELSLTGLSYLDPKPPSGPLLFMFVLDNTPHRIVAEVVRSDPTRRRGVRRVSLRFVTVPQTSGAALAEILTALQDAALETFREPCTLDLPPPGSAWHNPLGDE